MRLGARGILAAAAMLAALLSLSAGGAEEEVAAVLARGAKAQKARRFDEAREAYRDALRADPRCLPALAGLGHAEMGAGERGAGLEHLRRFVELVEADGGATLGLEDERERARARLRREDREGQRLERRIDAFVGACVRRAERRADDAPEAARAAWRDAAALRPDAPALGALAWRLDTLPPGVALSNGRDATGWHWLAPPAWGVEDVGIVGRAADVWAVCRTTDRFGGDYDLRCEVRVLAGGGSAVFLLQGAWSSYESNVSLGMLGEKILLLDGRELPGTADPPSGRPRTTRTPIDPGQWNSFELRFRAGRVTAVVRGEPIGSVERREEHATGHVALVALLGTVAFRRLEVVHR